MRRFFFSASTVAIVLARPFHVFPPTKELLSSLVADISMENKTLVEYFFPATAGPTSRMFALTGGGTRSIATI